MGKMTTLDGKLLFNDIILPHKFWGMTKVLDFDAMTKEDWVKIILSEFLALRIAPISVMRFLLPHQNLFLSRAISSADTMMVDYYHRTLKLGLTASLSNLIGDVLPTDLASKFLSDRRFVFLKALEMIADKATNLELFGTSLGLSSLKNVRYHVNEAITGINNYTY